jgi:hypothetical protein
MFIGLALLYLKTSEPTPALVETFT